jgi:hypothetical protein
MTMDQLLDAVTAAMADVEGFDVTAEQAKARGIAFPTRPQRLLNPGDVRHWMHDGVHYPEQNGYVDFLAWALDVAKSTQPQIDGLAEGWRVVRTLASQYIAGHYTTAKQPNLIQMFAAYAPAADGNNPGSYTRVVATKVGISADVPLVSLITEATPVATA